MRSYALGQGGVPRSGEVKRASWSLMRLPGWQKCLGARTVDRCSFIVMDSHQLLFAGLPALPIPVIH
jgi:hypothetical protein